MISKALPYALASMLSACQQAENFPRAKPGDAAVETEDLGDRWLVTYRLRGAGTGGVSSLEAARRSARIVGIEGTQ